VIPSRPEPVDLEHAEPLRKRPLEMPNVNRVLLPRPVHLAVLALAASLAGCSTIEGFFSGDKVDYRSQANKTSPLEVPPDLTQLQREGRYQPQAGIVSANNYSVAQPASVPAAAGNAVAPRELGSVKLERDNNTRWLLTSQTPEQVWPQLRAFWQERGFNVSVDHPEAGVMETDWAENRAKLPQDFIRNYIGKVLDSAYSTGERDKFRTRVERGPQGTEIYISHQGLAEVTTGAFKDSTIWQARPTDPGLEAEMLARLMVKMGAKEDEARNAVAATTPPKAAPGTNPAPASTVPGGPTHARLLSGQAAASLQLDEPFDRAWRRVGLSLDRTGFTVEDRDRANGIYYVRYADPKLAGKEEPNFFERLFSRAGGKAAPQRYRVQVQRGTTEATTVSVLDSKGDAVNDDIGKRIITLLVEDLK